MQADEKTRFKPLPLQRLIAAVSFTEIPSTQHSFLFAHAHKFNIELHTLRGSLGTIFPNRQFIFPSCTAGGESRRRGTLFRPCRCRKKPRYPHVTCRNLLRPRVTDQEKILPGSYRHLCQTILLTGHYFFRGCEGIQGSLS